MQNLNQKKDDKKMVKNISEKEQIKKSLYFNPGRGIYAPYHI